MQQNESELQPKTFMLQKKKLKDDTIRSIPTMTYTQKYVSER